MSRGAGSLHDLSLGNAEIGFAGGDAARNVVPDILQDAHGDAVVIGSGYPHLEEAYWVAEMVFPLLPIAPSSVQARPEPRPSIYGGKGMAILTPEDLARMQNQKSSSAQTASG